MHTEILTDLAHATILGTMTSGVLATWLAFPSRDDAPEVPAWPSLRVRAIDGADGLDAEALQPDPLVARIQRGDEQAFSELVHTYGERLFRFAYRELGSRESAEEVVQDIFANVWARRAVWIVRQSVMTYLFQAVRHRIHNIRRSQQVSHRIEQTIVRERSTEGISVQAPDALLAERDLMAALERALRRLPERPRQVFHLHREQRLSFRDIATVLDLSVRTVEHHMARAVAQLRIELAEWLQ